MVMASSGLDRDWPPQDSGEARDQETSAPETPASSVGTPEIQVLIYGP